MKPKSIETVGDAIVNLIKENLIAKTNVSSNVTVGDTVISVENSFKFEDDQEIVLIDYGYNNSSATHYGVYEYARIKEVTNTTSIELHDPVVSDWLVSDQAFIQKTIGHSPLYEDRVYYGDREVIPLEEVAITVEPSGLTNDWLFIQGGLDQEYRFELTIYGKSAETDEGIRIVHKYADALYQLMNDNVDFPAEVVQAPLQADVVTGQDFVLIEDTPTNREYFTTGLYDTSCDGPYYRVQDTLGAHAFIGITNVAIVGSNLRLTLNWDFIRDFDLDNYPVILRYLRSIYHSRVDAIEYGMIQKGSAFLRAAKLSWFGKEINIHRFPQPSKGAANFNKIGP